MAKRRKRRKRRNPGLLANPKRRRRRGTRMVVRHVVRRARRNPAFRLPRLGGRRGIVGQITQGVVDGAWIVTGKALTNAIPTVLKLGGTGIMGAAIKSVAAVVSGMLAGQFLGANALKLVTAGGFAAIVEPFIKGANIPVISAALGDTFPEYYIGAYAPAGELGAYVPMGDAEEVDAAIAQQQY